MNEPEPEWNDEDPSRKDFWGQFVIALIIVGCIVAVLAAEMGIGVEDRSTADYIFGGLILAVGGALCVMGIRDRSIMRVVIGLGVMGLAALALLGVAECHGDDCPYVE